MRDAIPLLSIIFAVVGLVTMFRANVNHDEPLYTIGIFEILLAVCLLIFLE